MKTINGVEYSDLEHMLRFENGIHFLTRKKMIKIYEDETKNEMREAFEEAVERGFIDKGIESKLGLLIEVEDRDWS